MHRAIHRKRLGGHPNVHPQGPVHKLQTIHEVEGDTAVKESEEGLRTEREKNRALNTVFCSILRVCLCGGMGGK